MTSEGLGEMFEGDVRQKISAHVDDGLSRGSSVRRPGSFFFFFNMYVTLSSFIIVFGPEHQLEFHHPH